MENKRTLNLVLVGICSAVIFLGTFIIKIPTLNGYVHLGDGFILACAYLLGYPAIIAAALGSAICDIISGYVTYALPTFIIKGLMAYIVILFYKNKNISYLGFIVAEIAMVLLYFFIEILMWGFNVALLSTPGNLLQGLMGVVSGYVITNALKKTNISFINK